MSLRNGFAAGFQVTHWPMVSRVVSGGTRTQTSPEPTTTVPSDFLSITGFNQTFTGKLTVPSVESIKFARPQRKGSNFVQNHVADALKVVTMIKAKQRKNAPNQRDDERN
jgi:hypothetical protein